MRKFETINRYGNLIVFQEIEKNLFTFKSFERGGKEDNYTWRVGGKAPNFDFVDPSGGPFISVGTVLPDIDSRFPVLQVKGITIDNDIKLVLG